ncbi:MAG: S41 family peptidase [Acidobacteriota bacterium]
MTEEPRVADVPKKDDKVSKSTLLLSVALVAVVAFVAGTRSDQLYAAIAPVFGIKASADTLDTAVLQQAFRELKANYDGSLDAGKLTDGAARGMVAAAGDRYTVFMDKEEAEQFNKDLRGEISGIGCEIGVRGDQATVLRVLADSPAQAAGVKVGDIFVSVNGESVEGLDASTVAGKVRGEKGTTVKLVMQRGEEQKEFTITRAQVTDASVRWSIDGGIGTITMSRFDDDTAKLATQAATEFKAAGVKGVVLDLRGNGGGYLSAAVDVAGIWLDNKVVVTEKANGTVTGTEKTRGGALLADIKTIVLVNGASASASEIVAGALQDHKVATLVGEKTFGKGTVQKVVNLRDGRMLKVTIARWYTPNGKNITKEGISPDKKVELTGDDANAGRDPQLEIAKGLF